MSEEEQEHRFVGAREKSPGCFRHVCSQCGGACWLSAYLDTWTKRTANYKIVCIKCFSSARDLELELMLPSIKRIMRECQVSEDRAHALRANLIRETKQRGNTIKIGEEVKDA